MDKETLSNYGWIVICVLVLAVMIALATPFGTFVADAVKSTTQGLFDVNQNALNSTGLINIDGQEFDSCAHEYEMTGTTANCTTAGTTTYTCKLCNKSYSEETSAQHTFADNVCENCGVELREFTIDGIKYQYEKGMTFEQWINSEYNIDDYMHVEAYYTSNGTTFGPSSKIVNSTKEKYVYCLDSMDERVSASKGMSIYETSWQLKYLSESGYTIKE